MNAESRPRPARSCAAMTLLCAALLVLAGRDADAQVYATDDCILPANAVFVDEGPYTFGGCYSLYPPGYCSFTMSNVGLAGFGDCSPPPDPGSSVVINRPGSIGANVSVDYCTGSGDSPRVMHPVERPDGGIVRLNRQEGATRYFDIQTPGGFQYIGNGYIVVGAAVGQLTIEDLGNGLFRFDGYLDADVQYGPDGCGFSETGGAHLVLTPVPTTDAPGPHMSSALTLAPSVPNPVRSRARIRFTLPQEEAVTLKIYDLAGRQVVCILDGSSMASGVHEVEVDTRGWRSGCYFYRLTTPTASRAKVMVVAR